MATVKQDVTELVIGPTDNDPRTITLGPGDVVPDWALAIYSNPRLMNLEEGEG